jgi:ribose-phosphate pyrophosphokinase
MMTNLRIFGLGASRGFADEVAAIAATSRVDLGHTMKTFQGRLNVHREERRPDGEAYTAALDNVRGTDVFVISSLYGDEVESVDEKFMKASLFINTLHHASASRITLVAPYLCYARQDKKMGSREPISTQAIAIMLEAIGVDRLLTMDVHNLGAEQNAFRIPIDNLEGRKPLADVIASDYLGKLGEPHDGYRLRGLKVLTPDAGGTSRTKLMQESLEKRLGMQVGIVYADKTRKNAESVKVQIIGDVNYQNIIVVDDLISTGGTIAEVCQAVRTGGGHLWGIVATHGLFVNSAPKKLEDIPRIYITDTIQPFRLAGSETMKSVKVVPTAPMFAEAIRRIHLEGGSISELLDD